MSCRTGTQGHVGDRDVSVVTRSVLKEFERNAILIDGQCICTSFSTSSACCRAPLVETASLGRCLVYIQNGAAS